MNRLFLALEPSSIVRRNLSDYLPKAQEKLDRQGMRWVTPPKFHVPLVDLGEQDAETVSALVAEIVLNFKAPHLTLTKINASPDTKRPGEIWLGVEDVTGHLEPLQKSLSENLMGEEDEEFVAQLTIARMKPASTKLGHKLRDFMHSGARPEDQSWTPEAVSLFQIEADGKFTLVDRFPFKA